MNDTLAGSGTTVNVFPSLFVTVAGSEVRM
jgi:hypothetical protein